MDPSPSHDPSYVQTHLLCRKVFRNGILWGVPLLLGAGVLVVGMPGVFEAVRFVYLIGFWCFWAFGVIALFYLAFVPCPRCRRPFHKKREGGYYAVNHFTRECLNCGINLNGPYV